MAKRFIEWVEYFCRRHNLQWQAFFGIVIGIVVGISYGIWGFTTLDRVPVTAEDYAPLEQQIVAIQETPALLFTTDCNVNIKDSVTTITLENSKCKLTVKLDPFLNVLDTNYQDKPYTFWGAIRFSLFVVVAVFMFSGFAIWLFLWILYFFVWLSKQIYWNFRKPKKENTPEMTTS